MTRPRTSKDFRVTDHAVVRYLERVMGYDLDKVREQIATDFVKAAAQSGIEGSVINGDGLKVFFKDGVVTTVFIDESKNVRPDRQIEIGPDPS